MPRRPIQPAQPTGRPTRPNHQHGRSTTSIAIAVSGLALISGAIIWGFFADSPGKPSPDRSAETVLPSDPAPIEDPFDPVTVEEPVIVPEPMPVEEPAAEALDLPEEPVIPALKLEDSDAVVREAIRALAAGPVADQFAASSNLIQRAVSLADNMAEGSVPYKLIPIARPKTPFPIRDNGLRVTADPAGHARFDGLASWVSSLDAQAIASLYVRFESLADEAYGMLGYEAGSVRERLDKALRLILTVPEVPADAELMRQEAVWIYADEALESMPDLHKQLLRLGPTNLSMIQDKARELSYALDDTGGQ